MLNLATTVRIGLASMMRSLAWTIFSLVSATLIAVALAACTSGAPPPPKLPNAGQSSTQVGPGDLLQISVVGEKDLPNEFRVQSDGTIDFPYIERIRVAGLEPQGIVDLIRKKLAEDKILTDPQVSLFVKAYESKKVRLVGQVQKPGNVSWNDGRRVHLAGRQQERHPHATARRRKIQNRSRQRRRHHRRQAARHSAASR